jgi:hypothetical protein
MREAVNATPGGTYCTFGGWGKKKNNCQDWTERVRKKYRELLKEQRILDKCCPITAAEKKK